MNIIIRDLDEQTHREVIKCIGNYGEVEYCDISNNSVDVRLDESVIVKTHFDSVTLDLGGKLATIERNEFRTIRIY